MVEQASLSFFSSFGVAQGKQAQFSTVLTVEFENRLPFRQSRFLSQRPAPIGLNRI
jgi:hypothetical protein